jgi:iron(III) transport system permease protein
MRIAWRGLAAVVAWLAVLALIGWPILRLGGVALEGGLGGVLATLSAQRVATAVWNSLWTSAFVTLIAVVLGTAAAVITERAAVPGRRVLRAGMLISLVVPPFVGALGWARSYGPRGLTDQLIGWQLPGLYGPVGIIVVLAVAAAPLAYLIVAAALANRVEPELERAARASGATAADAFRTITLPLLRPALLSASVVTFVFGLNAFGVPAVLGTPEGFSTITTRLYQDLARSADPAAFVRAATLAGTLVVLALGVVGSADAFFGGHGPIRASQTPAAARHGPGGWAVALAMGTAIVVVTVVPLLAVALTALTRAVGLAPVPANWTLGNFHDALDGRLAGGLANSLLLAIAAATIVLMLGGLVVAARSGPVADSQRPRSNRRSAVGSLATLGFAVPGSALAVAVLLAWGGWLRDTLLLILVAYVAKFWALGYRQLAASIDRLPPGLVRAARASGAGALDTLGSVTFPLLRPSILAGWLVVFVFAVHELTMSSLLYGPGTATLAVVVLNAQQLGDPTVTAALAIVLTAITAAAAVPLGLLAGRGGGLARLGSGG